MDLEGRGASGSRARAVGRRAPRASTPVLVALALVGAAAAGGCSANESIKPPAPASTTAVSGQSRQPLLDELARALSTRDVHAGAALDAPGSHVVEDAVENASRLGIGHVQVRDVDDDTAPGTDIQDHYGSRAEVDTIEVRYRLPGDPGPTALQTELVVVPGPGGSERVVAIGAAGAGGALWLEGPVQVRRTRHLLLIAAPGQDLDRYWRFAQRAVADVDAVLPRRSGPLVFEVPGDEAQLEQLLGTPAGTYRLIAGVTGSVDGSLGRGSPVHSFFNPDLMRAQGASGGQLVVSHEATLQATRAPLSTIPIWLEEGFADYVPLRSADLPLRRTAREIARQVRASGPPAQLPTQADFNATDTTFDQLNAVYESAWLACRLIAEKWGEATLLDFYAAVDRGEPVAGALRDLLGLSTRQFVTQWQHYLVTVAHES